MDKRTLLAIVLSVALVIGSFFIQSTFFAPKPAAPTHTTETVKPVEAAPVAPATGQAPAGSTTPAPAAAAASLLPEQNYPVREVAVETDLVQAVISTSGAAITSYKLKSHKESDQQPVEMINTSHGAGRSFELSFSGFDNLTPLVEPFQVVQKDKYTYEFSRVYLGKDGKPFTLIKTYQFVPGEYLFQLKIDLVGTDNGIPQPSAENYAYTLQYGPQMGPNFTALDGSNEYRKYFRLSGDNRDEISLNNERKDYNGFVKWVGMTGKYFAFIAIPDNANYLVTWSNKKEHANEEPSKIAFSRPPLKGTRTSDTFKFYLGPKEEQTLSIYDKGDKNAFQESGLKLTLILENNPFLGWLEVILKWIMQFFYYGVAGIGTYNWGVAIILLTIFVKAVTWPLTAKSYKSMAAMQTLQPKLQELQAKYKNDPQKLNAAMAEFYKKEGVNPLSGCLPMLLQLPILFALFGVFSNHFDLRGAVFIPGWISDLSAPDSVFAWDKAIQLPFIGNHLRLLPILMVGTQIWTSLISQPAGPMTTQNKIMVFALPAVMFLFFYSMPSGLQLYWILSNALQGAQQMLVKNRKVVVKGPVLLKKGNKKISN